MFLWLITSIPADIGQLSVPGEHPWNQRALRPVEGCLLEQPVSHLDYSTPYTGLTIPTSLDNTHIVDKVNEFCIFPTRGAFLN